MTPRIALIPDRLRCRHVVALGGQLSVAEGQEMPGSIEPFSPAPLAKAAETPIVILQIGRQHAVDAQPADGRFGPTTLARTVADPAPIAVIHCPSIEAAILGHAIHVNDLLDFRAPRDRLGMGPSCEPRER